MKIFQKYSAILFVSLFVFSNPISAQKSLTDGYKLVTEKSGVSFYYKDIKEESGEIQPLTVGIKNTNTSSVEIEWIYYVWYNGNCRSCMIIEPDNFYYKKMILKPGFQKALNYSSPDKDGLVLYKRYKNSFLTKIEFAQLKVKILKDDPAVKTSDK